MNGTLAAGASKEEVIGVITAMNPYVGFPRTLWMLKIANECIEK
ncbi:carboxymuconolactone decarboxylase family protein [Anaerovibrio sp.]